MDEATAKGEGKHTHAEPEAEVQEMGARGTFAAPTPKGQGTYDAGVQEGDGTKGPWFILIPGEVNRWRECNTEELAIEAAKEAVASGRPLVYVAKVAHYEVNSTIKRFLARLLIERKPTVFNEGETD